MAIGEEGKAFCQLQDKSLLSSILVASWCPTMDLLAFASADRQLCVHRLNWQRLWTVAPEPQVTALCWRPDGKAVAAGHDDGSVAIHDVENGEVRYRSSSHSHPITALSWDQVEGGEWGKGRGAAFEDRAARLIPPPPPPVPRPGGAAAAPPEEAPSSFEGDPGQQAAAYPPQLSVLVSADAAGRVCMRAYGIYVVADLDLAAMGMPGAALGLPGPATVTPSAVRHVSLSTDLRSLACAVEGSAGGTDGLYLASLETDAFGSLRPEVGQLAVQAHNVSSLLDGALQSVAEADRQWSGAMGAFREKIAALDGLLRDHGSEHAARAELLSLLGCGVAGGGVHQWLTVTLGEAALRRLAKKVDAAGAATHELLCGHAQPAVEAAAFRIGELRGLARARGGRAEAKLGLARDELEVGSELAGRLLVRLEGVLRGAARASAQLRVFFTWLLRTMRQLDSGSAATPPERGPAVDSASLADFLSNGLEEDWLGGQLSDESQTPKPPPPFAGGGGKDGASGGGWGGAAFGGEGGGDLAVLMELALGAGGARAPDSSLWTLRRHVTELRDHCAGLFARPVGPLSRAVAPTSLVCLDSAPSTSWAVARAPPGEPPSPGCPGQETLLFHRTPPRDPSGAGGVAAGAAGPVVLVRPPRGGGAMGAVALEIPRAPGGGAEGLEDVAFYRGDRVAMLLSTPPPGSAAEGEGAGGGAESSRLVMAEYGEVPFTEAADLFPGEDLLSWCSRRGAEHLLGSGAGGDGDGGGLRRRGGLRPACRAPLAVSAPRGVACVLAGARRALVYDLEEDEEFLSDNEDDGGGGGEEE